MISDEIVEVEKKRSPRDYKEKKEAILSNTFEDSEFVVLGNNRGQLLMRLPTRMTNRMKLTKGAKVKIIQRKEGRELVLNVRVPKNEKKTK